MGIDLLQQMIPLGSVPGRLPLGPDGKPISVSTVRRWIRYGIRGVRLEITRVGGRIYVTIEALERFLEALSSGGPAPEQSDSPRVAGVPRPVNRRAAELADQRLQQMGV